MCRLVQLVQLVRFVRFVQFQKVQNIQYEHNCLFLKEIGYMFRLKYDYNNKFKSGGLHEKHVVTTWKVGNHLSICF
jgi:hypothetical protein